MNEDFVPFSLAKKLKEKGFNPQKQPNYLYYNGELVEVKDHYNISPYEIAPTIEAVMKWLREEKEIFIRVTLSYDYSTDADGEQVDRWTFWLFEVFSVGSGSLIYTEEISEYDSYELAAIAGIEYVIDNLI